MVYNVDSNGLVIVIKAKNKIVKLQRDEELTLMLYVCKDQTRKTRSKGRNYVTLRRKKAILEVWKIFYDMQEVPSIYKVRQLLDAVKINGKLKWCGNLSQTSINEICKFIKNNA